MNHHHPGSEDAFRPPAIPTEVCCLHCGKTYESYLMEWVPLEPDDDFEGFWCCPTAGCDGAGFLFDIFPTDPDYVDEEGQRIWEEQPERDEEGPEDHALLEPGDAEQWPEYPLDDEDDFFTFNPSNRMQSLDQPFDDSGECMN